MKKKTRKKPKIEYTYKAAEGSRLSDEDAEIIGNALEEINTKQGTVTAVNVLEAARKTSSPLHTFFEWDDSKAAEQYRLEYAGKLIRWVKVTVIAGETTTDVRAYVNVDRGGARSYVPVAEAFAVPDYRDQIMERALAEQERWCARYQNFTVFAEIVDAVARVRAKVA